MGTGFQTAIFVVSSIVTISGFTIKNSDIGVVVNGATNAEIANNNIAATTKGIQATGVLNILIQNNVIEAKEPVSLAESPGLIVRGNTVTANTPSGTPSGNGIIVVSNLPGGFSGGLIENNDVTSDFSGIVVSGVTSCLVSNIEVRNNRIFKSVNGIQANNAPGVIIRDNLVFQTDVSPPNVHGYGIVLGFSSSGAIVPNNEVHATDWGIQVGGPNGPLNVEIKNNLVYAVKNAINQNGDQTYTFTTTQYLLVRIPSQTEYLLLTKTPPLNEILSPALHMEFG